MKFGVPLPDGLPANKSLRLLWRKNLGDQIVQGETLLTVEYDNTSVEVPSPRTGKITGIAYAGTVHSSSKNQNLGIIECEDKKYEGSKQNGILEPLECILQYYGALSDLDGKNFNGIGWVFGQKALFLIILCAVCPLFILIFLTAAGGFPGFLVSIVISLLWLFLVAQLYAKPDLHSLKIGQDYKEAILKLQAMKEHDDLIEELRESNRKLLDKIELADKFLGEEQDARRKLELQADDFAKKVKQEKDEFQKKCVSLEGEIANLKSKIKEEQAEKIKLGTNIEKMNGEVTRLKDKMAADLGTHMEQLDNVRADKEKAANASLEEFKIHQVINSLNERLSNPSGKNNGPLPTMETAILYGLMQEHVPDKERMKELSLIPHELRRAQHVEKVTDWYSTKIDEVERSDLSEREKRDKINAYRTARERELGIEG